MELFWDTLDSVSCDEVKSNTKSSIVHHKTYTDTSYQISTVKKKETQPLILF